MRGWDAARRCLRRSTTDVRCGIYCDSLNTVCVPSTMRNPSQWFWSWMSTVQHDTFHNDSAGYLLAKYTKTLSVISINSSFYDVSSDSHDNQLSPPKESSIFARRTLETTGILRVQRLKLNLRVISVGANCEYMYTAARQQRTTSLFSFIQAPPPPSRNT